MAALNVGRELTGRVSKVGYPGLTEDERKQLGPIDFHVKETGEGIVRFIRISRWMDGCTYDSNIFYTFEDMRLNVDLRNRVV